MNKKVITAYKKAEKVISSSKGPEHFKASRNYINNFFRSFCIGEKTLFGLRTYDVDPYIGALYENLLEQIRVKEYEYERR